MTLRNLLIRFWLRCHKVQWRGASPHITAKPFPRICVHEASSIRIGSHCRFGGGVVLAAHDGGSIELGDFVSLNDGGAITATQRVTIGSRTRMAAGVVILDDNFHPVSPDSPRFNAPVVIGRNVWLATRVTVLAGVSIGDHTIVSAGSVVKHDLPDRVIAAGNPARIVARIQCPDDWHRP